MIKLERKSTALLLNELWDVLQKLPFDEEKHEEILNELFTRPPFEYFIEKIKELELEIARLKKLKRHFHVDGKVTVEI